MTKRIKAWLVEKYPAWIFLAVLLLGWEYVVAQEWVASYLLPSPTQIFQTTVELWPEIYAATLSTANSIAWGLGWSAVSGVTLALLFFAIPIVRRAVLPFCIFFQTVPIISIAPLLVIWFGFGQPTVRASAFIVSIFPILANTLTGLQETDPHLKELFRLYRPSPWQLIFKLQIPSAIPYILTGIKISAGLAVIGAIVGEFIAGGGLGSLIDAARTQQRVDLVFSGVVMSSVLALLLVFIIEVVSRVLLRGRPYLRKL
ncbi:Riboflavin transport system permease protein RibX [Halioglobus japonicus]|nr:Riboflavin transport system permease protein RibX [Halioglobus japonicus]